MRKFIRISSLEFKNLVRTTSFRIVFGIVVLLFLLQNLLFNANYYIGPEQPLTTNMTLNRITLGVFIMILLMIWAGELIFREHTTGLRHLTDSFKLPVWVRLLSKYTAIALVSFILSLGMLLAGLLTQLSKGYLEFEWTLYVEDLLGYKLGVLTYMIILTLTFLIASITGKRFMTHILSIGILLFLLIAFDLGVIEDHRLGLLVGIPGIEDYSEIGGYGILATSAFWYFTCWSTLAVSFILLAVYFWRRGNVSDWRRKLSFQGKQLNWSGKLSLLALIAGFIFLQSFISKNIKDNFNTQEEKEGIKADYELRYAHLAKYAQPKIMEYDLDIELYPNNRKIAYVASYRLVNDSGEAIDTLYLNFPKFSHVNEVSIGRVAVSPAWMDTLHRVYAIALPERLPLDSIITIKLSAARQYKGFSPTDIQIDMATKGLLIGRRMFPILGYDDDRALVENKKRKVHGLEKIVSKMPDTSDLLSLGQNYFSKDAMRTKGRIKVGTSAPQIVLVSGRNIKRWKEKNRNYVLSVIDEPSNFDIHFTSYAFAETQQKTAQTNAAFYFKPSHHFNVKIYQQALDYGLTHIQEIFGSYPYKSLEIGELAYYKEDFYTSPNLILISEKQGWRADASLQSEESYLYYSIISQLIGQTLNARCELANVQGADMLDLAIPQAMAMQVISEKYGRELVNTYLTKKQNAYNKDRNNEPNIEFPLIYADGSDYLETNKGVIALYHMSEQMGFETFNNTIINWLDQSKDKKVKFIDLYEQLIKKLPLDKVALVKDKFEKVAPYGLN